MTDRIVRLAGRGLRADGAVVTWTIADGRRGRRWRESVARDGQLLHSLLYETGTDRRFAHLELAAPLGLVTLHPEGDDTLHGNIVTAAGVEHVVGLAFEAGGAVLVTGSLIAAAAVAWAGERDGDGGPGKVVVLDPVGLSLRAATADATSSAAATDPDGIPQLRDGRTWSLER